MMKLLRKARFTRGLHYGLKPLSYVTILKKARYK